MIGHPYYTPTQNTAPVANTTAGKWTFYPGCRALYLQNTTGQTLGIAFNGTTASGTVYDYTLANSAQVTLKAEDIGVEAFDVVSIWVPASGTAANIVIRGA